METTMSDDFAKSQLLKVSASQSKSSYQIFEKKYGSVIHSTPLARTGEG